MTVQLVVAPSNLGRGFVADAAAQQYHVVHFGDVKAGLMAADHNGWYLLNGRAKASLPAAVQVVATALGIGTNLPNAAGRFLKQGTPGSVGGAASATLTQAHLPSVTLTAATAGAHAHTAGAAGNHTHGAWHVLSRDSGQGDPAGFSQGTFTGGGTQFFGHPTTGAAGTHTHTTDVQGAHSHTVPLGGAGSPVAIDPPWLGVNWFVYLG